MSLAELRREFEAQVIGPDILSEVRRACSLQARRYPPSIYARASAWGPEELEDLSQDVIVDRLLGQRQIFYLFDVAGDLDSWRALLVRQVRVALARRRVRTVIDNLLDRARRILRASDASGSSDVAGEEVFGAVGADLDYRALTDAEVRAVVERARIIPRQVPGRGDRAPTVYPARQLEALLRITDQGAPRGFTIRDLGRILEFVLTDWVPAVLDLDDGEFRRPSTDPNPEQVMEIATMADRLVSSLSTEESEILRGRLAGLRDVEVAERLGVSRPTLGKRRNTLFDRIRATGSGLDVQAQERLIDEIAVLVAERGRADE